MSESSSPFVVNTEIAELLTTFVIFAVRQHWDNCKTNIILDLCQAQSHICQRQGMPHFQDLRLQKHLKYISIFYKIEVSKVTTMPVCGMFKQGCSEKKFKKMSIFFLKIQKKIKKNPKKNPKKNLLFFENQIPHLIWSLPAKHLGI
jgi:hypothetical protein